MLLPVGQMRAGLHGFYMGLVNGLHGFSQIITRTKSRYGTLRHNFVIKVEW